MNDEQKIYAMEKIAATIHGWGTHHEHEFLYATAKSAPKSGVIVEIGSWKGKSTIFIAEGSKSGNRNQIYAVDPFTGSSEHQGNGKVWTFDEFKNNMKKAGHSDIVTSVIAKSEDAVKGWNKPISFLFIDGAHEYEEVEKDFLLWSPHVVPGGTIAFHDAVASLRAVLKGIPLHGLPGPRKVFEKYILSSSNYEQAGSADSIAYTKKVNGIASENQTFNHIAVRIKIFFCYLIYSPYKYAARLPQPIKTFLKKFISV